MAVYHVFSPYLEQTLCSVHIIYIIAFYSHNSRTWVQLLYPFSRKETETLNSWVTCARPYRWSHDGAGTGAQMRLTLELNIITLPHNILSYKNH